MQSSNSLPIHVGIIMDGNGRWAKRRGLPRKAGHQFGAKAFRKIVKYANKIGIKYLTVYAFSTENWKRPDDEISGIIGLLREYLSEAENYKSENIRTRFIGDLTPFDEDIRQKIDECEKVSENFKGMNLNIAINYGGRQEIINAFKKISTDVKSGALEVDDINESIVANNLYTYDQPEVDLVIRPSGEQRISNFLLWQSAYAEFVYMDVLWPDFNEKSFDKALLEYAQRNRRFGGI